MKIALVVPGGVDRSGRERVIPVLLGLIERLAEHHEVRVFALRQYPTYCRYELLGAGVTNLGQAPHIGRLPGSSLAWRYHALLNGLRDDGPFDLLHAFWASVPGFLATALGRRLGIPAVISLAGGELAALPEIGYGGQLSWTSRLLISQALRGASRITAASHFMVALAEARGFRAEEVPLGIDASSFPISRAAGSSYRLLHVASLNRVKDQFTLLKAMRRLVDVLPDVRLDIVGEDTLGGEIQRYCRTLGLDRWVTFHGFVPNDELHRFFREAHLLVLSSRHEAGPVVALEAAACGLTVVGTAVGHLADWAGERAWTVPVGDDSALAEGMLSLLRDSKKRTALGEAAQAWARSYDADWTAARFQALYEEVARGSTR